jgi:hypothetical protein
MDPQGGAALEGAVEVALEAVRVGGYCTHHLPGEAALGEVALVVGQDLLAGVDPQVAIGEPSLLQGRPCLLGVVVVVQDGDQNPLGLNTNGRSAIAGSWAARPMGQTTSCSSMVVGSFEGDGLGG